MYLSEVEIQVSNKASGVLFMTTEDNHAATISLELGSIVGLSYSFRRGMRAIEHICSASIASFSFNPIATIIPTRGLDRTETILELLKSGYVNKFEQQLNANKPAGNKTPVKKENTMQLENDGKDQSHAVANKDSSLFEALLVKRVVEILASFVTDDVSVRIQGVVKVGRRKGVAECLATLKNSVISLVADDKHHKKIMALCEQALDGLNSEAIANIYKLELLEYLGPLANFIFEDEVSKHEHHIRTYADLEHLLYILAAEIDNSTESDEYIKSCLVSIAQL